MSIKTNLRKLDKVSFQNLIYNSQTDLLITKRTLDNILLADTRYYLEGLNELTTNTYVEKKEKHIYIANSKRSGLKEEVSPKLKLDLEYQSKISRILNDFGLYIANVNLLDFESNTGDVCTVIDKDTLFKKHFTLSAFTGSDDDKNCIEYKIRVQTLFLNDLNLTAPNSSYLDFVFIKASEFKEILSLVNRDKIKLGGNMIFIVNYSDTDFRLLCLADKANPKIDNLGDLILKMNNLENKDNFFIRKSNDFELLVKPYRDKVLDKKYNSKKGEGEYVK